MNLELTTKDISDSVEIVLISIIEESCDKDLLKQLNFEAKNEQVALLLQSNKMYVGYEDDDNETIKIAIASATRKLIKTNIKNISVQCKFDLNNYIEGFILGGYVFDRYKSEKSKTNKKNIYIQVDSLNDKLKKDFDNMLMISKNINFVRDMINTSPEDFNPNTFVEEANKITKNNNLKCTILDSNYFKKHNMGAIDAVGRASQHDSKLIHMSYQPKNPAKKIVLVGKGLTYDCGGLSLKPSDFMVSMKSDKSGGCAVLGIMSIVSQLELPIEVHGIVGAVENMIGGNAYKPDDILIAKNKKTIEIRNTDAEGRLVLADCLCYAQDEIKDIDYIIDFATLTGASVVGVGHYTTSIMGNNNNLNYKIVQSAIDSGELATTLPFNRYLRKTIKSKIADICNISSTRYGGAITAGMFLDEFIQEQYKDKWVHCDIAGPAYVEEQWGYNSYGASGAGVRMTIEFLKNV